MCKRQSPKKILFNLDTPEIIGLLMVFVEAKYFVNIIIMSAVRFNLTFVNDAQKHFQIRYRYLVNV